MKTALKWYLITGGVLLVILVLMNLITPAISETSLMLDIAEKWFGRLYSAGSIVAAAVGLAIVPKKWNPCEKKLPKSNGRYPTERSDDVLVTVHYAGHGCEGDYVDVASYSQKYKEWESADNEGGTIRGVTAWMPKPEPYTSSRIIDASRSEKGIPLNVAESAPKAEKRIAYFERYAPISLLEEVELTNSEGADHNGESDT